MKVSKSYTEYEDSVILDWVKKYPHNLSLAFNGAAHQLSGRTFDGIRYYWYHVLKNKQSGFVLKSDSVEIANKKNISEKKELHGAEWHLNSLLEILQTKREILDIVILTLKSIKLWDTDGMKQMTEL